MKLYRLVDKVEGLYFDKSDSPQEKATFDLILQQA